MKQKNMPEKYHLGRNIHWIIIDEIISWTNKSRGRKICRSNINYSRADRLFERKTNFQLADRFVIPIVELEYRGDCDWRKKKNRPKKILELGSGKYAVAMLNAYRVSDRLDLYLSVYTLTQLFGLRQVVPCHMLTCSWRSEPTVPVFHRLSISARRIASHILCRETCTRCNNFHRK